MTTRMRLVSHYRVLTTDAVFAARLASTEMTQVWLFDVAVLSVGFLVTSTDP
jgi:hypothetical protein